MTPSEKANEMVGKKLKDVPNEKNNFTPMYLAKKDAMFEASYELMKVTNSEDMRFWMNVMDEITKIPN